MQFRHVLPGQVVDISSLDAGIAGPGERLRIHQQWPHEDGTVETWFVGEFVVEPDGKSMRCVWPADPDLQAQLPPLPEGFKLPTG